MNARNRFAQFLAGAPFTNGVPAAFFQHFSPACRHGQAALDAQLDFFEATGMDMVKIMFDDIYPKITNVHTAADWCNVPRFDRDDPVFTNQLALARRVVEHTGQKAYVFQTIFSPFVSAGCAVSPILEWDKLVTPHFAEEPEAMAQALRGISDVLAQFAQDAAATGIDGFYVSIQGGEYGRYSPEFFNTWFKPIDIAFLQALMATGKLVFLHLCGTGMRLEDYYDYPGHIVNLALRGNEINLAQAQQRFGRPIMGGLNNNGAICTGSEAEIKAEVAATLRSAPPHVMLGADCTIPQSAPLQNLRWAVEAAHAFRP